MLAVGAHRPDGSSTGDLRLDGESTVDRSTCPDCGADYLLVKSFVLDDSGPYAIAFIALHWHGEAEAWIDVIFGAFEGDAADDDRTMFRVPSRTSGGKRRTRGNGCPSRRALLERVGVGHKLSRDEALAHPVSRTSGGWWTFLMENEPAVAHHIHGHRAEGRRRW
ncbi:MAG: hypothetical protein ACRCYU_13790 [Nocardioides sp.]